MTFAQQVIDYHFNLKPDWNLPKEFELIYPFGESQTQEVFRKFYKKYFTSKAKRKFLFGINPGRFGAGVTGVPFTDPFFLENKCGIKNDFPKRKELSAIFIHDIIEAMGGLEKFYQSYYITSICPLGFLKNGINANYYDDKNLQEAVTKYIVDHIKKQIEFGCDTSVAFSLGKGKNFRFFKTINDEYNFFEKVLPLPHPRWVMQYNLKRKDHFLDLIIQSLNQ